MAKFQQALLYQQVVELGSMAAAARERGVAPSVVTKHLAELEANLGVQLLTRTTRKIVMTEAGEHFYHSMCSLGGDWQALQDETSRINQNPAGKLTIAAPSLVHSRVVMKAYSEFQASYPDIELELRCVDYLDLPFDRADVSLARKLDGFDSSSYVGLPIYSYRNQLFASPEYIAKNGEPSTIGQLSTHRCLSYGAGTGSSVWRFANGESLAMKGAFISNDTEVLVQAALRHQGIIYLPKSVVADEVETGRFIPILEEQGVSDLYEFKAYFRKQPYLPRKVRALLDHLTSYAW